MGCTCGAMEYEDLPASVESVIPSLCFCKKVYIVEDMWKAPEKWTSAFEQTQPLEPIMTSWSKCACFVKAAVAVSACLSSHGNPRGVTIPDIWCSLYLTFNATSGAWSFVHQHTLPDTFAEVLATRKHPGPADIRNRSQLMSGRTFFRRETGRGRSLMTFKTQQDTFFTVTFSSEHW